MRWLLVGALLLAGLFYAYEVGSAERLSDAEVQLLMEITGPTWGLHQMCIDTPNNEACTDLYECSTPPEFVEVYKTNQGQRYEVFTDCIDWSLDCPYDGVRDRVGQNCRWNVGDGYIQVWIRQNGLVIEEVY